MSLFRAVQAVADASGDGPIDWTAVATAAKAATTPGELALSDVDEAGYARDVRAARTAVRSAAGVEFDLPRTVQIHHRHHWIDANLATFERLLHPLENRQGLAPSLARSANTGSMAVTLAFLANNVLGQYDPLLLADEDHELYFVHPNIDSVADDLAVDRERFRRWIAFHEVAHAAEFGAAPWLAPHLEDLVAEAIESLAAGRFDREPLRELNVAMTAVEGYAELIMDRAFDEEYVDLRAKLDARRRAAGPVSTILRRLLGFDIKRRQYEQGRAFFDAVAEARGVTGAAAVWEQPANLPTRAELDDPQAWLHRVA